MSDSPQKRDQSSKNAVVPSFGHLYKHQLAKASCGQHDAAAKLKAKEKVPVTPLTGAQTPEALKLQTCTNSA
jgi:hypothetical protein